MRTKSGFTLIEVLVVISIIALLIGIFLPALGAARRTGSCSMKSSSQLRGVHQSAVIFANSNGSYLPGMNSSGVLLDSDNPAFAALSGQNTGVPGLGGGAFNTRLYILLNGNFISGDMVLNPLDTPSHGGKWSNSLLLPAVPTPSLAGQFSYSLLNIADSPNTGTKSTTLSPGRVGEWRDNANSQSVLIADRNSAENNVSPRSIWATSKGTLTDWKGNVVWGDNHAEFLTSSTNLTTKYLKAVNTADSLFIDGATTESPGEHRDNAFFNYTSANY